MHDINRYNLLYRGQFLPRCHKNIRTAPDHRIRKAESRCRRRTYETSQVMYSRSTARRELRRSHMVPRSTRSCQCIAIRNGFADGQKRNHLDHSGKLRDAAANFPLNPYLDVARMSDSWLDSCTSQYIPASYMRS